MLSSKFEYKVQADRVVIVNITNASSVIKDALRRAFIRKYARAKMQLKYTVALHGEVKKRLFYAVAIAIVNKFP